MLIVVLAACSGPSTRDATRAVDATPSPTSPATAVAPTVTQAAPVLPTTTATPLPVATGTATPVPVATPTPRPSPTPTATPPPGAVESAMLAMLPAAESLPQGWSLVASGPVRGSTDGASLCGVDRFPDAGRKLAEVEAEYQRDDPLFPASVLQNVVAFPEPVAIEALAWARGAIVCREWTGDDGTTIELGEFTDAGLGDESLSASFTVVSDGMRIPGQWYFVRRGGLIATIVYLGSDADAPVVGSVVDTAVRLLDPDGVATAAIDPAVQSTLLGMVLAADDLESGWMKTASGPTQDAALAGLCGVWPFAGSAEKLGDVSARYESDATATSVEQRLVALPAVAAPAALDSARESLACVEWIDDDGIVYSLDEPRPLGLGDDGAMTMFVATGPESQEFGAIYVVRVGAVVGMLVFRAPQPVTTADTLPVVERAVDLIRSGD